MTPVQNNDSRGGRFYVFELDANEEPVERFHEDDLTAEQRATLGLPPLPAPSVHDSPQATEEVGPDV